MNFEPHDYQAYAIDYIETHPVAAVLLDMGLGKTVISLTAIADLLFDSFVARRVLVVAPLRVARDTWPAELEKWSHLHHLTYTVAVGSAKERRAALMQSNLLTGKAMIVAYSRPIAMKIYHKLLELRPAWKEKIGVVMTGSNNDPEDWKEIIGTKAHKEELARKFKDNSDPMKIAIVVDMWLTGFDVPSLATMYVYKPMHGYNLMQAIARVNRVFKDKEGGLIVDYVGIASALKAAMKEYTKRDQSRYGDMNIALVAYPKFKEKLQVCKDLLHGYNFSAFFGGSPLTMAKAVTGGVNFVLDPHAPERKDLFLKEALLLRQSHSLCSSMVTDQERHEAAYMEAVRSTVVKITYSGTGGRILSLKEIN